MTDQGVVEEPVVITKEMVTPSHLSRYCETTEELHVLVDVDRNLWVTEGVPVDDKDSPNPKIVIPNSPYVFMAHNLWVNDSRHKELLLNDVPVIFSHGYRDNNTWRFSGGQSVSETVEAYNDKARVNNTPEIEFVISCNEDNTPDSLGIKVKDLQDGYIAQAVGEVVYIYLGHRTGKNPPGTEFSPGGKVTTTISVDGEFWGLDELITKKGIKVFSDVDQNGSK